MSRSKLKVNDFNIRWLSKDSHFLFDRRRPDAGKLLSLAPKLPFYPAHIYIFSSGSEKTALLSKEAFLTSAEAVNKHLGCRPQGRWLIPLPLFHVAGAAVSARAFCGGYSFAHRGGKWEAAGFVRSLKEEAASYTSLVPAQVFDLTEKKLSPPPSLELALTGGGAIAPALYRKARALGWPLLPTYGMTEVCSQIATVERSSLETKDFPLLKVLPHIDIQERSGVLRLRSPSLLTGYFSVSKQTFYDPKTPDGWFSTQDRGEIKILPPPPQTKNSRQNICLIFKGRADDCVKVSGRLLSLSALTLRLQNNAARLAPGGAFCLTDFPHKRKGREIALVTDVFDGYKVSQVLSLFNKNSPPYERVKAVYMVGRIPRTPLFKTDKAALRRLLSGNCNAGPG